MESELIFCFSASMLQILCEAHTRWYFVAQTKCLGRAAGPYCRTARIELWALPILQFGYILDTMNWSETSIYLAIYWRADCGRGWFEYVGHSIHSTTRLLTLMRSHKKIRHSNGASDNYIRLNVLHTKYLIPINCVRIAQVCFRVVHIVNPFQMDASSNVCVPITFRNLVKTNKRYKPCIN